METIPGAVEGRRINDRKIIYLDDAIDAVLKRDANCGIDSAEVLRNLPSEQPQRKTGEWVGYDGDWLKTMFKCSECGAMIDINEKYRNFFCYHCGADMREE